MKVLVIGGTGHVGKFMVPMLVEAGCEVAVAGSGRTPVPESKQWKKVHYIKCDINSSDTFPAFVEFKPRTLINMPGDSYTIYQHLKKNIEHVIACGSLWMYGEPKVVPTPETVQNPCPFPGYANRMDLFLKMLDECPKDGVMFTGIMPPNICGPGKIPLECLGGRSLDVHREHMSGKEVILPDGPDVLIGPCDAEDIARCFVLAALKPKQAAGRIFNVGSDYALCAAEFVRAYADIYGSEIPVRRVGWEDYINTVSPGKSSWWHYKAHMCPDISGARDLLGYEPKYTPEQTLERAVDWMKAEKLI